MSWRTAVLVILALVMVIVAIVTWGSVGSALCAFLLILMAAAVLYRKYVLDRDEDMFDWEL